MRLCVWYSCSLPAWPFQHSLLIISLCRALLTLEVSRVQQYPFQEGQKVEGADWELYVAEVAADILTEQSPKR